MTAGDQVDPFRIAHAAYREAGWLGTLPLPAGAKFPPPGGWTGRNADFPNDDQIDEWLAMPRYAGANIALRVGETPDRRYEIVGLDVDHYSEKSGATELADLETKYGALPATWISTSRRAPSGIRFFRVPVGLAFKGKASASIDVVQRVHRYAVAWPSWNPSSGAQYVWLDPDGVVSQHVPSVNDIPLLPNKWVQFLTRGGMRDPGQVPVDLESTEDEVDQWVGIALPTAGGQPCARIQQARDKWIAAIQDEGSSSHDKITGADWELVQLALDGHTGLLGAIDEVRSAYVSDTLRRGKRAEHELRAEVTRSYRGALRRAKASVEEEQPGGAFIAKVCACPTTIDEEAFWSARPYLSDLRQFARSRRAGPWAVLGQVLARAIATIPPWVVLPPTVGGAGSLNLDVALVGPSGAGKGISAAVAADWLCTDTEVFTATLGSGEGLAKVFAYRKKHDGTFVQVGLRNAALFEAPEVDNLVALSSRSSSTLMPQLRSAWSGEELGFSYADPLKTIHLRAHRYRLCLVVGVQPGRARPLLGDAAGGTPQRFIWLPVRDPEMPDKRPAPSSTATLPSWVGPEALRDSLIDSAVDTDPYLLDVPVARADLTYLEVAQVATNDIETQILAVHRGEDVDPLDGHKLQTRLKVAAALMWLDGRKDAVNEHDWELAGIVMQVSDRTRSDVERHLRSEARRANRARGSAEGEREVVKTEKIQASKATRVGERIMKLLQDNDGQTLSKIKQRFGPDKPYVHDALERLVEQGRIQREMFEHNRRPAQRFWLNSG